MPFKKKRSLIGAYEYIGSSTQLTKAEFTKISADQWVRALAGIKHEVFLSFRGQDTRASFISHLYASLRNDGIIVFIDDHSLQTGDCISTSLLEAIKETQIDVVVFSRNYADSRWCLDELAKIMECRRTTGKVVFPVFYDVDPSEVRHQTGEFGKAFQSLLNRVSKEEEDKSLKWRDALREAASLAGIVVLNSR
jgi:hypothetical protein